MAQAAKKTLTKFEQRYVEKIRPALKTKYKIENDHAIPEITKIVINMGVGAAVTDRKAVEAAAAELALIAGQKPVITFAKKSNAAFKVRDGMAIGCKVTLRREQMYEFLDRLVTIALPRIRDFRGISGKSFDGRGNYAFGLKEQTVFPEITFDKVAEVRGMDIIICTSAANDDQARELLRGFDMPFRDK